MVFVISIAHWLAIEGVQPAIVQNPTPSDAKSDLFNKRIKLDQPSQPVTPGIKAGAQPTATGAAEVQPLVKHVLSKELQMYYERITSAVLSQDEVLRATAISSLQNDPGLHQLLPYFVQLVAEKVKIFETYNDRACQVCSGPNLVTLSRLGYTKHQEYVCSGGHDGYGSGDSGQQQPVCRAICKTMLTKTMDTEKK